MGVSFPPISLPDPLPEGILKGKVHSSTQLEKMRRMLCFIVISMEVIFKAKEEEGGDGIDWVAIGISNKAERNIFHLLPCRPGNNRS